MGLENKIKMKTNLSSTLWRLASLPRALTGLVALALLPSSSILPNSFARQDTARYPLAHALGPVVIGFFGNFDILDGPSPFSESTTTSVFDAVKEAAEMGHAASQFYFGTYYIDGYDHDGKKLAKNEKEGVKWIRQAAEQGWPEAQTYLGALYLEGRLVPKNNAEAVSWLRKAVAQGEVYAHILLGRLYALGEGGLARNEREALKLLSYTEESDANKNYFLYSFLNEDVSDWLRGLANRGSINAQGILGRIYYYAKDERPDDREKWLKKAATSGHLAAQHNLGDLYYHDASRGSFSEATKWYLSAANRDYARSQVAVGFIYLKHNKDEAKALEWFRKAADQGYARGEFALGNSYFQGTGVPRNLNESVNWFLKAAEKGDRDSQAALGLIYSNRGEINFERNYTKGVFWLRKAAEQGEIEAQARLGLMYMDGEGINKDYREAAKWFLLANAMRFHNQAGSALGLMYYYGWGVEQNFAKAAPLLNQAAILGLHTAFLPLADLFLNGKGVKQDSQEAQKWLRQAAAAGYPEAQRALDALGR